MKTKAIALAVALAMGTAVTGVQAADAAREDATLSNAKVSLNDAINKAEKEGGGQAVAADYKPKKGTMGYYDIKVLSSDGSKLTEYRVSTAAGKVTKASNEPFEKMFTRIKPDQLASAPTSLKGAIKTAEAQSGGKAVDADADRDGDTVQYTVKVAKADGSTEKVKVNGADGKIASAK
jgi:uncharacterized membrane protein YkoI